jgi:hypothetical protein
MPGLSSHTFKRGALAAFFALAWAARAGGAALAIGPAAQDDDARLVAEFSARANAYAELHARLEATLGAFPSESTPDIIDRHQRALERLIVRERASARRGDIFTGPIRAYFRRQLSRVFLGPDGKTVIRAIMDEDTRAVRISVNRRYPDTIPRSSVPAQVLLVLPRLPEELEYRFVGEQLALLDVHADIVVDFMDDAIPR